MTSLTERYLAAALRGIPDRQRTDVEQELRSSIADAVEDRVAGGEDRAVAETAVLEGLGNPSRLAAGITGRPLYLIGPDLFLGYRQLLFLLLGIIVPIVGVVLAAVELGTGRGYADALLAGIGGAATVAVHIGFWVTLAFAFVERVESAKEIRSEITQGLSAWSVKGLPELPTSGRVGIGETIGEVFTNALTLAGLLFVRDLAPIEDAAGNAVRLLHPDVRSFWLPVLIGIAVALIGFEFVKFTIGRWTMTLAAVRTVLGVAFAVPFIYLALNGLLINPAFAAEVGWPPLAEGDGPVMLAIAAITLLVSAWEIVDAFRRARRR